ncbi:halocarboxylic acid dehydrogenase DehI family protein [Oceanobacillus halotolerans]|uniref:halocarboxylic acid dehydrogenase DehI family protein n=1 Tax=Oceanobacillus halotolerans TaxID=2663380 RepID=UPI0013DC7747|nr:halocarboxylic acid dehydrogenase DehI family protein [Oceanobacillus halotolerans]
MDNYGVPEIFESEAQGKTAYIYQDIKYVLKVPVVNFIFRTMALYDKFFSVAWKEVRQNMLTVNMEEAVQLLRFPPISIQPPNINWSNYDEQTAAQIRNIIFTFNYVNPKLLLIVTAWSESLANRPIKGDMKTIKGFIEPGVFPFLPKIDLLHIPEAPPPIKKLLLDIADVHQSVDVASDFRALALYPEFLDESWQYLKPYVRSDEYKVISARLRSKAAKLAHQMPYPVNVNRSLLENYYNDAEIAGIYGLVSMFKSLIADLIIDGEYLRRMIDPSM